MRTSYHFSHVPVSHSDQYLLFQTLRGAVDVVSGEVAAALKNFQDSDGESLTQAEAETLQRRGYLTEQTPEQERELARDILRLLSKNLPRVVELDFRFPAGAAESAPDDAWLDESYSLAGRLAGEGGAVVVGLEITTPHVEARALEAVLQRAAASSYTVLPRLTLGSLGAMTPWLKSENFRQALITTDIASPPEDDAAGQAAHIINFFNRQIHPVWKCHVDGMSEAQLGTVIAITESVRRKYPFFRVYPTSASLEQTAEPRLMGVNGSQLPYISAGNEALLSTLMRFILMAGKVNYRPFFQPEPAKIIATFEDRRLSFQEGRGAETVEGLAEISARAAQRERAGGGGDMWDAVARSPSRLDCKYALVCGCAQGRDAPAEEMTRECSGSFEQRLRQVLPLLLFNLPGNWRPAEAHA